MDFYITSSFTKLFLSLSFFFLISYYYIRMTEANSNSPFSLLLLFSLHQGQKMLVENSDTYTLNAISREAAGEYKCSLTDNEKMEASQNIVVSCEYCRVLAYYSTTSREILLQYRKTVQKNCPSPFSLYID